MVDMTLDQVHDLVQRLHHREQMICDLVQKKVISLDEVLTDSFLLKHTTFSNVESFFAQSPIFSAESVLISAEVESSSHARLDSFVQEVTPFRSWNELLHSAIEQYIVDHFWL